ncbi:threonine synthase [Candidatus Giovannonibacteria bacterium RIFCSPLOWO2_12_FULL_44_25]|uniref:Threonine synthase n=3 Tax=Parcubacteria group TaxID=1794811 RepID=A0A837IQW0_9BACT|nr:MAG: Threonine synthase [Parcubacteria group bacterium GW2011_GWC1_44_10]KKT60115.1 MAG: Threonine synthase [Candidatus Giovannonibacteria bacterium GW2011_GWA1_44_25]KKU12860.1 MAG: Threonine synthase [Candidatus Azambacteria bacterium GW2011_GWC2_45_7b]KKU29962.1 MAG: Threonine synthase [Candidatus Giovannonibacteria bacterium GW2011_GWB1_46_20]OGF49434.1 MAG: threonine synthase [Candidatus Giovannonibacteria bacterium GWA2_45_15]OGF59916.1 MAG: threonine synthase [Candidatus Giovannoniba
MIKHKFLPQPYKGILHKYWEWMPPAIQWMGKEKIITLFEGNTCLWRAKNFENYLRDLFPYFHSEVYWKLEGENRGSGSFKDRGMTAAITMAAARGKKVVICASTGNTAASAAVYAQAAGMRCLVVLPEGNVAPGKLTQSYRHGAKVIQIKGNFDKALEIVREVVLREKDKELVNSINPHRTEGQKTAAFEIVDELGEAPRYHFIPVGNGGNITAYWRGYKEYYIKGRSKRCPHMIGYQAVGAAPIVLGRAVENPKTIASAICIGNPAKWEEAKAARDESSGKIDMADDEEIMAAYALISELEPVSCEPSSAISVAGVIKEIKRIPRDIYIWDGCKIVCTLTGAAWKDPDAAKKVFVKDPIVIDASYDAVMDVIRSN